MKKDLYITEEDYFEILQIVMGNYSHSSDRSLQRFGMDAEYFLDKLFKCLSRPEWIHAWLQSDIKANQEIVMIHELGQWAVSIKPVYEETTVFIVKTVFNLRDKQFNPYKGNHVYLWDWNNLLVEYDS